MGVWEGFYFHADAYGLLADFRDNNLIFDLTYSPERLLMVVGGFLEITFLGEIELADSILAQAKSAWPDEEWEKADNIIERITQIHQQNEADWRDKALFVLYELFPGKYAYPTDYTPYLVSEDKMKLLFLLGSEGIKELHKHNVPFREIVRLLIDLWLNVEFDLLVEVEEEVRLLWKSANWGDIYRTKILARDYLTAKIPNFEETINMLINVTYRENPTAR